MFQWYSELSKAVDIYNSRVVESEILEYTEVLNMIENRYDEQEVMQLIINLYSWCH